MRPITLVPIMVLIMSFQYASATPAEECVQYDAGSRTILISCEADFIDDIVNSPSIVNAPGGNTAINAEGNATFLLNSSIFVDDSGMLDISSVSLKIVGERSIDVEEGMLTIDNSTISSWNTTSNSTVKENANATIPRAWILIDDSQGGYIRNSDFGSLGYESEENGRGGLQLDDVQDFEISNSKFHDMYFAFYSNDVEDVKIHGNEYYDNLLYALDPHTGTSDTEITNNKVYDNAGFGIICSLDCTNVLIANNDVHTNHRAGIMLSRNTTDSTVINNTVRDHPSAYGVFVSQSSNNTVTNNTLKNNMYGVYVKESTSKDNIITNNNITVSKRAIVFSNVTDDSNIVRNNSISKSLSYEYFATKNSKLTLDNEKFHLAEVRGAEGDNVITIQNSGTITIDGNKTDTNAKPFVATLNDTTIEIN